MAAVDEARSRLESELARLNQLTEISVKSEITAEGLGEQRAVVEEAQAAFDQAADAYLKALSESG